MLTASYLGLLTATFVLMLSPGPSVILAIRRQSGTRSSRRHGHRCLGVWGGRGADDYARSRPGARIVFHPSGSRSSAVPASLICSFSVSSNSSVPLLYQLKSKVRCCQATPTGRFGRALWWAG